MSAYAARTFYRQNIFGGDARRRLVEPKRDNLLFNADLVSQRGLRPADVDGSDESFACIHNKQAYNEACKLATRKNVPRNKSTGAIPPADMMRTIGQRLRFRRQQLGLSQGAVAEAVRKLRNSSFTQQAYGALETDKSKSSSELPAVCEVLRVSLKWIRDGSGPQPTPEDAKPASNEPSPDIQREVIRGLLEGMDIEAPAIDKWFELLREASEARIDAPSPDIERKFRREIGRELARQCPSLKARKRD